MARKTDWKIGDRVFVKGVHNVVDGIGTIQGQAGSGSWRVAMDVDGSVIGVPPYHVRELTEEQAVDSSTPVQRTHLGHLLMDFRKKAKMRGGAEGAVWSKAAAQLEATMKDAGLK
jgi:hypothetical protein